MKRLTVLCLSLLLALSLCACGGDSPAEETADPATESATTETTPEAAPETESKPASENRYTGTGTLSGDVVTLDIINMTCTFEK